jgi:hypothetical protein
MAWLQEIEHMLKPLRRRIQTVVGMALVLALPALALDCFQGNLRRLWLTARAQLISPTSTAAQPRQRFADQGQVLAAWQDTQSITEPPFNISVMNNAEINAIFGTIPGLTFGTSQFVAAQTELAATIASETAFESNYKVISNNSSVYLSTNLISGFLHGELRAFSNLSVATSDPFTSTLLAQKANILDQEVNAFEAWYKNATKNNLSPQTILSQLTGFTKSFESFSQTYTSTLVQEINSGMINSSTFTYTPPTF